MTWAVSFSGTTLSFIVYHTLGDGSKGTTDELRTSCDVQLSARSFLSRERRINS